MDLNIDSLFCETQIDLLKNDFSLNRPSTNQMREKFSFQPIGFEEKSLLSSRGILSFLSLRLHANIGPGLR